MQTRKKAQLVDADLGWLAVSSLSSRFHSLQAFDGTQKAYEPSMFDYRKIQTFSI